ncbi:NAD(P)-dependent oxidoreductase [Gandjariella thermophila]|uniref:Dehydrogenase n=1 Tax=Gandjariella thermophila TaxID=1931992 RepID=A0A4D4J5V0_9PSEU|nr:NAD(P)-dependent oxidoreductase [Gandjariella thermophila]GDY30844.1 dehydrogenase [Gandjariella thermophila]
MTTNARQDAGKATVAVLGTGIMGFPMARNIARGGFPVRAWNRTRSKAEPLAEDGATVVNTPAEAVDGADVLVTMLSDGAAVADAITAAAPGLGETTLWLQTSTVGLAGLGSLVKVAGQHNLNMVDAPVLGTRAPAEQGKLVVLAAGPEDARDRAQPVFDAIAQRTMWVGDSAEAGAASRLKLALNSWVLAITNAVGEAVGLAEALGVDPGLITEALGGGTLDTPYLHMKAGAIIKGDYTPSFTVRNAEKDARLIEEAARHAGVRLDVSEAAAARLRRAIDLGHGDDDMAAAYFANWEGGRR